MKELFDYIIESMAEEHIDAADVVKILNDQISKRDFKLNTGLSSGRVNSVYSMCQEKNLLVAERSDIESLFDKDDMVKFKDKCLKDLAEAGVQPGSSMIKIGEQLENDGAEQEEEEEEEEAEGPTPEQLQQMQQQAEAEKVKLTYTVYKGVCEKLLHIDLEDVVAFKWVFRRFDLYLVVALQDKAVEFLTIIE